MGYQNVTFPENSLFLVTGAAGFIGSNLCEANLKACLCSHEAAGEAFNNAYGVREYLIDIYYVFTKTLGVKNEPHFGPCCAGDIKHSNADISKARKLLGYDPDWNFDRGIKAAIEWYKENL